MIEYVALTAVSTVSSAICIAVGYWLGQRRVEKFSKQADLLESHVEMCRRSLLEVKEEVGNIYQHLQTADIQRQKKDQIDLDHIERMMKNAIIGGEMPEPPSPAHPSVGSGLGSFRSKSNPAGAKQ